MYFAKPKPDCVSFSHAADRRFVRQSEVGESRRKELAHCKTLSLQALQPCRRSKIKQKDVQKNHDGNRSFWKSDATRSIHSCESWMGSLPVATSARVVVAAAAVHPRLTAVGEACSEQRSPT
jgi:hypothetical protein